MKLVKTQICYEIKKGYYSQYPLDYPIRANINDLILAMKDAARCDIDFEKLYQYPEFEQCCDSVFGQKLRRPCIITYVLGAEIELPTNNEKYAYRLKSALYASFFALDICDRKQKLELGHNVFKTSKFLKLFHPLSISINRLYLSHEEAKTQIF